MDAPDALESVSGTAGAPAFGSLGWRLEDTVAVFTLDRQASLNALDVTLKEELLAAFTIAAGMAEVRAVVLTGAGRAFCVGQDLTEAEGASVPGAEGTEGVEGGGPIDYATEVREHYNPLVLAMRGLEKPIVAAVNGVAAGAGLSLAVACDVRIAAEGAVLVPGFGAVGLVPDSGLTWLLPRIVGAGRAAEILLGGKKLDAAEAERIGLVNAVVPADRLLPEAIALAATLGGGSPLAIALTKRALNLVQEVSLEEALDLEAQFQGIAGRSAEHAEGLAAFREKRPPDFRRPARS